MAMQDESSDGTEPEHNGNGSIDGEGQDHNKHPERVENPEVDSDETLSDGEQTDDSFFCDQDASNDLARAANTELKNVRVEAEGSGEQRPQKKRSSTTAGLNPAKEKPRKRFRIPKGTTFLTTAEKNAEYENGLRHYYSRKEPTGSHKIGIVCRERCSKHFMISDWGEARRHYKKAKKGNFKHLGAAFDKNQFKTMSKSNAEKRAKRIRSGGVTDHASESDSDVHESDYGNFNSVPGRPNADQAKVAKATKPRKSKKGAEDAKQGDGKTSDPQGCMKKCSLLQEALEKAQTEVERLVGIIVEDRKQRTAEIISLGEEGAMSDERVNEMLHNISNIEEEEGVRQYRWKAQILPQVLAGVQMQVSALHKSQGSFNFQPAEPIRFSPTAGLHSEGLPIDQPAFPPPSQLPAGLQISMPPQFWNIDPSLQPYLTTGNPYSGPVTLQQLELGDRARDYIETLQRATRIQGYELRRDAAISILDQLSWDDARVNALSFDAQRGDWTPRVEDLAENGDEENTKDT